MAIWKGELNLRGGNKGGQIDIIKGGTVNLKHLDSYTQTERISNNISQGQSSEQEIASQSIYG